MQQASTGIGLAAEEIDFIGAVRDLGVSGVKLREVMLRSLQDCLGRSAGLALMRFMGDEAFGRPVLFIQKLEEVFGTGSPILLEQLAESTRSIAK